MQGRDNETGTARELVLLDPEMAELPLLLTAAEAAALEVAARRLRPEPRRTAPPPRPRLPRQGRAARPALGVLSAARPRDAAPGDVPPPGHGAAGLSRS